MLEKYLQDIGLSDKESVVYLALSQVEDASVLDLAKKTKIKRPTVYVILESLSKKGLVSEITLGKKVHYQAAPPERLETFVERRKLQLEESSRLLKDLIPQIKSISRESGEKPIVKYFEGKEGIISMLEELFTGTDSKGGETYLIYPKDDLDGIFSDKEKERYRNIRISRGIKSKVFYTSEKGERASDSTGDRVKIDAKKYPITCDISIYEDKVRISTLGKKLSGIFIKNKELAETLKSLFNLAFDNLRNK